jgi:hypothetical protein
MLTPIWFLITEEIRVKLRALMPADWLPPREDFKSLNLKVKLEDLEELAKIMTWKPRGRRLPR